MKHDPNESEFCPRCGGPSDRAKYGRPGALSRWDNRTEVCTACGQDEAMAAFAKGRAALDPWTGARGWDRPPLHAGPLRTRSIRLTDSEWDALADEAREEGVSPSALIRSLIRKRIG